MDEDTRQEIAPDCFSWRDLPEEGDYSGFVKEMREVWHGKVEWGRFTFVNEEFPNPPYPPGLYFEGWSKAPHSYDPPRTAAPFSYPLVAQEQSHG